MGVKVATKWAFMPACAIAIGSAVILRRPCSLPFRKPALHQRNHDARRAAVPAGADALAALVLAE